ncbi:uncharacterized protein PV09_09741 [Verruconis gallopava]|uniref:Methyltransferase domain-containing protein n=1 Tax=Verruconis gallopava TaxID=253628 RepID=A0A0D2AHQ6_9PEZI|nr:uncharacterized protein PV09_09741 [Verruconis gallopava]KIV98443.1 hypothetical protein PV09_09741 [Verruconis gallopava]
MEALAHVYLKLIFLLQLLSFFLLTCSTMAFHDDESDSAIDSWSNSGDSCSLSPSLLDYRLEDGRTYHAYPDVKYLLPNDEQELNRLDLQHELFLHIGSRKLYIAPLPQDVQSVLDLGTGTGIWAIDFADQHESACVVGLDISPVQPKFVPPNCSFYLNDIEKDWMQRGQLDFVHLRDMATSIRNWHGVFEQAMRHLKPGGYIELQEFCFPYLCHESWNKSSKILNWSKHYMRACSEIGLNLQAPLKWEEDLRKSGFEDVHIEKRILPLGTWAKGKENKISGVFALENLLEGVDAMSHVFTTALGWSKENAENLAAQVKSEALRSKVPLFQYVYFCYARKPE